MNTMTNTERLKVLLAKLEAIKAKGTLDGEEADRSENLHRLFMYPAMMVPATQSAMIEAMTLVLPTKSNAIDPYMGSGTSLLSCMEFGFNAFGQDINPFAVLLSKAKTTCYDLDGFKQSLLSIRKHIQNDNNTSIDVNFASINKWFNKDIQIALSKIRRAIMAEPNSDFRNFFWVIMSEAIRVGSNDRTSTFKLHIRSQEDIQKRNVNIIEEFLNYCERGINDLADYRKKLHEEHLLDGHNYSGSSKVVWGNTQTKIETDTTFDLLVSSPPYGDNHTTVTYGQTSYLPLQWIDPNDIICPYDYLKTTQEIDRQSLGGRINGAALSQAIDTLFKKSPTLANFYKGISKTNQEKYKKTLSFIADFDESLDAIMKVMKPNAFYIWTIGNRFVGGREIPNSEILIDLMNKRGVPLFFDAERRIMNKKQARRNRSSQTMEKERILIFHHD
jgi:hypothetical protein